MVETKASSTNATSAVILTEGCDEVGRGPLAGDVVAAAVILGISITDGLKD